MSFPKAKVKRFNEIKSSTPSPADYNIKTDKSQKYGIIPQSGRFVEPPSPAKSDTSSSTTFRTPVLPKKRRALSFSINKITNEGSKEKTIDCDKKDLIIQELNSKIEELKEKIVENEIYEKQKLELEQHYQQLIQNEQIKYENKIEVIQKEIMKINEEQKKVNEEQNEIKRTYNEEREDLVNKFQKLEELNTKIVENYEETFNKQNQSIAEKEDKIRILEQKLLNFENKYSTIIKHFKESFQNNLHAIKDEFFKKTKQIQEEIEKEKIEITQRITEIYNFYYKELTENQQKEKEELIKEYEAKIKLIEENFAETTLLSEIQTKQRINETELNWELKLKQQKEESDAILKECQKIGEHFVSESEIEKNLLKQTIDDKELQIEQLQQQINELITKQDELVERKLEIKQNEIERIITEKRTYEITLNKSLETVEVLKKRLINSDKDVMQLKEELTNCEDKIVKLENKYDNANNELQQKQTEVEELEMQNESTLKLCQSQIDEITRQLLNLVDGLKIKFVEKVINLENKTQKFDEIYSFLKEREIINKKRDELFKHLTKEYEELDQSNINLENVNQNLIRKMKKYELMEMEKEEEKRVLIQIKENKTEQIEFLQRKCDSYEHSCEYYKNKVEKMEKELDGTAEIQKKYIEINGKYDELLNRYDILKADNEKINNKLLICENLIGPFREQLEAYEFEKNTMLNEKRCLESEAKEIGLKYAQILGHQNHKQKIKHLVDLKESNNKLTKEKRELEAKNSSYVKMMEKLKKEIFDLKKVIKKLKPVNEDKENLSSSLNLSLNSSSSEFPLRQRNN